MTATEQVRLLRETIAQVHAHEAMIDERRFVVESVFRRLLGDELAEPGPLERKIAELSDYIDCGQVDLEVLAFTEADWQELERRLGVDP